MVEFQQISNSFQTNPHFQNDFSFYLEDQGTKLRFFSLIYVTKLRNYLEKVRQKSLLSFIPPA